MHFGLNVIDPATWEAVARVIERREILRADYRRLDGKRGSCEIGPLHPARRPARQ